MGAEWFKVEVLQDYSGEDSGPSLASWLEGDKQTSVELMNANVNHNWVKMSQNKIRQGVKLIRIHILDQPFTPYIEWEQEHYKQINTKLCGERVYLLDRCDVRGLTLPKGDLMIFDKKVAVVNSYNAAGAMTAQTFFGRNDDISPFLKLRLKLLKAAAKP